MIEILKIISSIIKFLKVIFLKVFKSYITKYHSYSRIENMQI